jgi:hypothetical protein
MNIESWYVHCCAYDVNQYKYSVETFGPFPSIQKAIDIKAVQSQKEKYSFIDIDNSPTKKLPTLA